MSLGRATRRAAILLPAALLMAAVWSGCATVREPLSPLPVRHSIVREPLIIHSDVPLPAQHRLFNDLKLQREDLLTRLALPGSDEPIHVFLFESSERFQGFMQTQYPHFPIRRAFFVEKDTTLEVYAHWGDRVSEDLRHEVSHGHLHAVVPNIPLWLDEGLAEFFETPREDAGLNRPHVNELAARLAAGGWRPDARRLEALRSAGEMTQADYAEAWAWAHWLLTTTPERLELLRGYLRALRQPGRAAPLSEQIVELYPDADRQLAEHIFQLALPPATSPAPSAIPVAEEQSLWR